MVARVVRVARERLALEGRQVDDSAVGEQVQALVDAGAQELIFNLPLANDADDVTAAGEVLKKALA